MSTSLVFERDDVLADLNRRATDAKEAKDWPAAIALLQQAKKHEGAQYQDTRLAMYLQQAGRFDESMAEFEWLLSMVPAQCDASEASMTPNRRRFRIAYACARIHNQFRIAASREKRADLTARQHELHQQHQEEAEKLKPVLEREWKKERRAYDEKEARLKKQRQARPAQ